MWRALQKIPSGSVTTYADLARAIGRPRAARAVAQACARNPHPIVVPCHRVVASDGSLGGYSGPGGVARKAQLLRSEGVRAYRGSIVDFHQVRALITARGTSNIRDIRALSVAAAGEPAKCEAEHAAASVIIRQDSR